MELARGAWNLSLDTPTLPPATATNTLILGHDRLLVIEPATPHERERARLDALLDELRAQGRTIAGLAVTHHHPDHIGYAFELRERYGVPLLAHPETAARLRFEVDETIEDDWTIELGGGQRVRAVHTPGHAPGHLVFWDEASGIAHAGDLVAGVGSILIDPRDGGDMTTYLESLRRVAEGCRARTERGLDSRLVPAHGPVIDDPVALLEHYVRHRLAREDKVRQAVLAGARDFDAILAQAYADTPPFIWPIAAHALDAHLRKLVDDGELTRTPGAPSSTGYAGAKPA